MPKKSFQEPIKCWLYSIGKWTWLMGMSSIQFIPFFFYLFFFLCLPHLPSQPPPLTSLTTQAASHHITHHHTHLCTTISIHSHQGKTGSDIWVKSWLKIKRKRDAVPAFSFSCIRISSRYTGANWRPVSSILRQGTNQHLLHWGKN